MSLSNYVKDGVYFIKTYVTWVRFLHSCTMDLGSSNKIMTDLTYDMNPMEQNITELMPNSEYNITVIVTNAIGNRTKSVMDTTMEAGM